MSDHGPTRSELTSFLTAVFGELPPGLFILVWTLVDKASRFFTTVAEAEQYIALRRDASDVYVGVGLRAGDLGRRRRGGNDSVVALVGFAVDIDTAGPAHTKKNLPPDEAAALALLDAMPLTPTLIVQTGHGLQAWWLFDEVYRFDDGADRQHVAALWKGWERRLREAAKARRWDVDTVADLARVLRIPGTINYKLQPVAVRLLRTDGPRYGGPADFLEHIRLEDEPPAAGEESDAEAFRLDPNAEPPVERFAMLYAKSRKFRESWERTRTDLQDQSASAYDLCLAAFAVAAGWTDQQIVDLFVASRRKHGDDLKLRDDYYRRTLTKARAGSTRARTFAATADEGEGVDQAEATRRLQHLLGVEIGGLLQFGVEQARYTLQLADGREVPLGAVTSVLWPLPFVPGSMRR